MVEIKPVLDGHLCGGRADGTGFAVRGRHLETGTEVKNSPGAVITWRKFRFHNLIGQLWKTAP